MAAATFNNAITIVLAIAGAVLCEPALASSVDAGHPAASTAGNVAPLVVDPKCPKPKPKAKPKPSTTSPITQPPPPPANSPTCPACPAAQPPVQCPAVQPEPSEKPGFWDRYGKDTIFSLLGVILGSIVSLYTTVVFERYKRFREVLLDVSQARQLNDSYPTGTRNLEPNYRSAIEYWRTIERKRWTLDADGHHAAAAQVGRLQTFAYTSALCIEHMLNNETLGLSPSNYLSAYQAEFNRIVREENFTAFERQLRPTISALLRPYPHSYSPVKATTIVGDSFFRTLLR